ncbi:MAG TPA: hypothetical protein VL997_12750, partial [Dyella sp.]|nr:hypothetical protein [Dyella sp.]
LRTVQERARAARHEADTALTFAREKAAEAAARAHEHNIAALMGNPPPAILTRSQAAAALRDAEDVAADAEAAARAIAQEIETLQATSRDHSGRVTEAARAVMREESQDTVQTLVNGLHEMHRAIVEGHKLLSWLIRNDVVNDIGPRAIPGASELTSRTLQPMQTWAPWAARRETPATERWDAALAALKADAAAEIPK